MIVLGRVVLARHDSERRRGKEAPMVRRNAPSLLVGLILPMVLGLTRLEAAEAPARLPSTVQLRLSEPPPAPLPAEPAPEAWSKQVSQRSQLEYSSVSGDFAGPVPAETLVQYALANNPQIQAARAYAFALGARVPQAASLPDPQLMTTAFLQAIQTAAGPQEVAMSLSQRFPWYGKLALRSQVAYHDAMAAYARLAVAELKVAEQVKRTYYEVYFLQHAIEVIRALQPRLEDVVKIAQWKYENHVAMAGIETVYQAQIELSGLDTRLIGLEQAKVEAQAQLAAVLHLAPDTRIDAVAELDRTKVAHTVRLLVDLAESYQPELAARRREIRRDRAAVALACRDYWPDVTVGLNWYEIGSSGLSPIATGEDAYSLSVGVNLPIYRKRLDAAVREARWEMARSSRQYAATHDQVSQEVQALYAQFIEHHRILKILEWEIVPLAEKTLDRSIQAYELGNLEFQRLIANYEDLLKYQIDYYQREARREQVIASLERAVGCAISAWPAEPANGAEPLSGPQE